MNSRISSNDQFTDDCRSIYPIFCEDEDRIAKYAPLSGRPFIL
jgi:hypothetical protein